MTIVALALGGWLDHRRLLDSLAEVKSLNALIKLHVHIEADPSRSSVNGLTSE
jgi:hypothetical protein